MTSHPARSAEWTSPRTGPWPVRGGTDGDGMTDMTAPRVFTQRHAGAVALGLVTAPPGIDVLLLAPRMSGGLVRQQYLAGEGFYSCVSAETDASGVAWKRLLALAAAVGSLRRGAIGLPAAQEALLDLLIEQTFGVYLGLGMQLAFRIGVEAGLPAEALVLELYMSGEMAKTIEAFAAEGFFGSLLNHGLTALYGGFTRTGEVDNEGMERMFRAAAGDIQNGGFAPPVQRQLAHR